MNHANIAASNTAPNSQPFTVEAVVAGTTTTSGSVENCLNWCFTDFGCSLCSISDGGVSYNLFLIFGNPPLNLSLTNLSGMR